MANVVLLFVFVGNMWWPGLHPGNGCPPRPKIETSGLDSSNLCLKNQVSEYKYRVRKSKNFLESKIFHAKTFRIKRVNRDTFDFATKLCKIREFHIFFGKCAWSWIGWSQNYPVTFQIIRTVSGLSGQFLDYPDSLWIVRTVSRLSGQFLNYLDSLWIVRTVSRLSGQSLDCPDSF